MEHFFVGMTYIGTITGVGTKNYSKACRLEHLLFICPFIASNYQNFKTNNAALPIDWKLVWFIVKSILQTASHLLQSQKNTSIKTKWKGFAVGFYDFMLVCKWMCILDFHNPMGLVEECLRKSFCIWFNHNFLEI